MVGAEAARRRFSHGMPYAWSCIEAVVLRHGAWSDGCLADFLPCLTLSDATVMAIPACKTAPEAVAALKIKMKTLREPLSYISRNAEPCRLACLRFVRQTPETCKTRPGAFSLPGSPLYYGTAARNPAYTVPCNAWVH